MQWMSPRVMPPRATAMAACSSSQLLPIFGLPASSVSPSTMTPGTTYLMGGKVMLCSASALAGVDGVGTFVGLGRGVDENRRHSLVLAASARRVVRAYDQ